MDQREPRYGEEMSLQHAAAGLGRALMPGSPAYLILAELDMSAAHDAWPRSLPKVMAASLRRAPQGERPADPAGGQQDHADAGGDAGEK